MEWSRNLSYQRDDWISVKFDKEANLSTEINDFLSDSRIDKTELQALHYILHNNKELDKKQEILNTTDNLSLLSNALNNNSIQSDKYNIKSRINEILNLKPRNNLNSRKSNIWVDEEKQEWKGWKEKYISSNKYLNSNWELKNVARINLKTLILKDIAEINDLIWNINNFSVTDRNWEIKNVFLATNWNYYYKDKVWNNYEKVKIFDGDKLWKYNQKSTSDDYEFKQTKDDEEFTKEVISDNDTIDRLKRNKFSTLKELNWIKDPEYRKIYENRIQKLDKLSIPNNLKEITEKFSDVNMDDFSKNYPNFNKNNLLTLKTHFNTIKEHASLWAERLYKNLLNKKIDISDKNPITIYVPNIYRQLSLAFNYNPTTNKVEIKPFWYSYAWFWNDFGEKETPLWTFEIWRTKASKDVYGNAALWWWNSVKWAAMDTIWLDWDLNNKTSTKQWRWAYTHWLDENRSRKITNWEWSAASRWCRVYSAKDAREVYSIYNQAKSKWHKSYEEVMSPL